MPRCPPILKRPFRTYTSPRTVDHESTTSSKHWSAYVLPCFAVVLLLLPQPSWLILVTSQYSSTSAITQWIHVSITTLLTLGAINSLAICCFADPGRPTSNDMDAAEETYSNKKKASRSNRDSINEEEAEALMSDEEDDDPNSFNSSLKWCRTCWAPKPDRTHHCSTCNRCVLKMDHHCPWVSQCIGHRTYPSFLHLLLCVSGLASYIAVVASAILYSFLFTPIAQPIDDTTPLHCLLLVVMGFVFSLVVGSFAGYHIYLSFTNQTTVEQLSPYMLLKYLPKPRIPRHAPGTSIIHQVPASSAFAETDSPYHFPSPPPTPPPNKSTIDTPITPSRVFSSSPVATTTREAHLQSPSTRGYHEWDEHSLSFHQRRLVRHTASKIHLWDLGWKLNAKANLGSGLAKRDGGSRRRESGNPRPYTWQWWLSVLLYGGPPRGDGKTFPRNKRAKAALHELRVKLEQLEQNERGAVRGDGEGEEHEMDDV